MRNNKIRLGDLVNQKEGQQRNGLVLQVDIAHWPRPPQTYFLVEWPGGERQTTKSSFVEKAQRG